MIRDVLLNKVPGVLIAVGCITLRRGSANAQQCTAGKVGNWYLIFLRVPKPQAYRRNGVQEYLVWLTQEQAFRWYVLQAGDHVQPPPDQLGILRSRVFPGLQLAVEALLRGEMPQVLAVLPAGIASEVHRSFRFAAGDAATLASGARPWLCWGQYVSLLQFGPGAEPRVYGA